MAFSGSGAVTGAEYGSVVPFLGTSIGALAGGIFGGGGGSSTPSADPLAGSGTTDANIAAIEAEIANGTYQFGTNDAQAIAIKQYNALFGRNPTVPELNEALSLSDGNINGYIAQQYQQSQQLTPVQLQQQQQQQGLAAYQSGQAGYDATTNAAFQQATGQAATSDELSHFGSLLATGQIDAYGLSQLVGQTQQAQQYQTQQYQNQLSQNLQQTQGNYYQQYINPSILSQTAAAGRDPNSSGVQQAEVQAGQQQNYQLQDYLANFGASQYGQSAQNQQGVYQQYLNNQYGLSNGGINQTLQNQQFNQSQNANLLNYGIQQNAYQNYLNSYGKSSSGGNLSGGIAGAAAGAKLGSVGGPWGTAIGAVGGGLAGYFSGNSKGGGLL